MSSNPCLGFEPALKMALAKSQNAPYKTVRPKLNVSQNKSLILFTQGTPTPSRHGSALPDFPLALLFAKLHRLRHAQKPIDRNVKPICDLSQPVNVKRAEARVLKVDSAPAAKPDAGAELVVCDAAKAASDCEPLPKYEEIRFHTWDMRQPRLRRKVLQLRRKRSYGSTS
jgi:hypothetical protein